jgi:tetratricopeptide (TPR) repeat protein
VTAGAALLFGIAAPGLGSSGCALHTQSIVPNHSFTCAKSSGKTQKYFSTDALTALKSEEGLGLIDKDRHDFGDIVNKAVSAVQKTRRKLCGETPFSKYRLDSAVQVMETLDDVMKKIGFRRVDYDVRLLNRAIKSKRVDCDTALWFYSAVGQILNIPFEVVREHNHLFFRWRLADRTFLDWEPLVGKRVYGQISVTKASMPSSVVMVDDDSKKVTDNGVYGRGINSKEALALHYANVGVLWRKKGDFKKASQLYEEAYRANPKDPAIINCMGVAHLVKREYKAAIEKFSKTLVSDPALIVAYINRGITYLRLREYDKALEDFNKFKEFEQDNCKIHYLIGVAFYRKGEYGKAVESFDTSHSLNPKNKHILKAKDLALQEMAKRKKDETVKILPKVSAR